jgi:cytochrome P450
LRRPSATLSVAHAPGSGNGYSRTNNAQGCTMDLRYDPYDRDYIENPYPLHQRLRDEAPLFHDTNHNVWVLSRYTDVLEGVRDHAGLISSEGQSIDGSDKGYPYLVLKDPPEHSWYKAMVVHLFSPGKMAKLEQAIRARSRQLLHNCRERGDFDLVEDFAVRLPLDIISELLDIPQDYREEIHHWTMVGLLRGDDFDRAQFEKSHARRGEIYMELIAQRRDKPREDAITMLMQLEEKDSEGKVHHLDDRTLAYHFSELALAGHETVSRAIPNGALAFHAFPQERAKLTADPALLPNAVEEILRYDAPVQVFGRVATRDFHMHGGTIPAGGRVMLLSGSALRDQRAFDEADKFIVTRQPDTRSIYFGTGIHKCVGIHLARLEIRIAIEELLRIMPNFEVDPAGAVRNIAVAVRGPARLPSKAGQTSALPH